MDVGVASLLFGILKNFKVGMKVRGLRGFLFLLIFFNVIFLNVWNVRDYIFYDFSQ